MRSRWMWLPLAAVSASAGATHSGPEISEGLWEFTIRYDVMGVPYRSAPYMDTRCITDADPIPRIERPGHECTATADDHLGRIVSWAINCSSDGEMVQGMGRMSYRRDRADGNVFMQALGPNAAPQPVVFTISGRRLGNCLQQ